MIKILVFASILLSFTATLKANNCDYWLAQVDPDIEEVKIEIDEENSQNIINGIACLLTLQGNTKDGVSFVNFNVSQTFPKPSVEINALYEISRLFYGNYNFANAGALLRVSAKLYGPYKKLLFNSKGDVKKAFASYRKWFKKVKKIGLEEARKQKLNPLKNSGVRWY